VAIVEGILSLSPGACFRHLGENTWNKSLFLAMKPHWLLFSYYFARIEDTGLVKNQKTLV
jgi:hypothetical protein